MPTSLFLPSKASLEPDDTTCSSIQCFKIYGLFANGIAMGLLLKRVYVYVRYHIRANIFCIYLILCTSLLRPTTLIPCEF